MQSCCKSRDLLAGLIELQRHSWQLGSSVHVLSLIVVWKARAWRGAVQNDSCAAAWWLSLAAFRDPSIPKFLLRCWQPDLSRCQTSKFSLNGESTLLMLQSQHVASHLKLVSRTCMLCAAVGLAVVRKAMWAVRHLLASTSMISARLNAMNRADHIHSWAA